MIVYAAADLMWATRIKAMAEDLGIPARPVRSVEMLKARLADSPVRALIVDLDCDGAVGMIEEVRRQERFEELKVCCFGPHVKRDLMIDAREAGADEVMARSAFDGNLGKILLRLMGEAE